MKGCRALEGTSKPGAVETMGRTWCSPLGGLSATSSYDA